MRIWKTLGLAAACLTLSLASAQAITIDPMTGRPLEMHISGHHSNAAVDRRIPRELVPYYGIEAPGTIVVATGERRLYLVQPNGTAIRYGIGVARPGFEWSGVKTVSMKREWPDWRPPQEMLQREPDLPVFMAGGPDNPLGARALYLGSSLYRIHGSPEAWSIGQAVSSGCIRMMNEDVIDLYQRVDVGAKVVVR